jgi:branched-chain amino acid transport system permease protein
MLAQLLLSGLALGSIYALLALALVLVHKATDVINFAQGEMATFTTFISYTLLSRFGLPLPLVYILSFCIGAVLGMLVYRIFVHPLSKAPPINILIVTIGLWIVFNNIGGWIWGYDPLRFPSLLPPQSIDLSGLRISPNSLATIGVAFGLMALLFLFFEFTREGTAMRAASMNRWAAQLMGIRVSRAATLSWALAAGVGALAGLLVAPTTFLDFQLMVPVLLKSFASAILGGFNSLPGAVLGGLTIGILENLFGAYVSTEFKDSFSLLVIVAVLMFRPSGLFSLSQVKKV